MNKMDKKVKLLIPALVLLCALVAGIWFAIHRMEGQPPVLNLNLAGKVIGQETTLSGRASDQGSGLTSLRISIFQKGPGAKEMPLLDEAYPPGGFFKSGPVKQKDFKVVISAQKLGLQDGDLLLKITATDNSLRGWGKGNITARELPLKIDTRPPILSALTRAHYVNQGGVGCVIYDVSEPTLKDGVRVGENFFPGYSGVFKNPNTHLALFALNYDQGTETEIGLEATDLAGNMGKATFAYQIKPKDFKSDSIGISDSFFSTVLPYFEPIKVKGNDNSLLAKFLFINRDQRKADFDKIMALCKTSEKKILWEGTFLRMPNAAPRAGYADHRTYVYNGKPVDQQVHLGVDLASLALSPIPAANAGKVVFTGPLGIYGLSVFLDHGLGLFSHYSHLSKIDVKLGQMVTKGQNVGVTGATGMAGGDHLHYGMLLYNTFIDPKEWWDPHWIKDNVTDKIASVSQGENPSAAPQAAAAEAMAPEIQAEPKPATQPTEPAEAKPAPKPGKKVPAKLAAVTKSKPAASKTPAKQVDKKAAKAEGKSKAKPAAKKAAR